MLAKGIQAFGRLSLVKAKNKYFVDASEVKPQFFEGEPG